MPDFALVARELEGIAGELDAGSFQVEQLKLVGLAEVEKCFAGGELFAVPGKRVLARVPELLPDPVSLLFHDGGDAGLRNALGSPDNYAPVAFDRDADGAAVRVN